MDRRVIKTKTLIKNEIIKRMYETDIEKISIKDVCSAIDINRSTFYLHYSTISDVIVELEDEIVNTIYDYCKNIKDPISLAVKISGYIKENKYVIKALVTNVTSHFFARLNKKLAPVISENITYNQRGPLENNDYIISFIINGSLGTFKKWIENDCEANPNAIIFDFLKTLRIRI